MDELTLRYRIAPRRPADLAFANCVRLTTLDHSPGALGRSESEARRDPLLDEAGIAGANPQPVYSENRAFGATISANGGRIAFESVVEGGPNDDQRTLAMLDTQTGEFFPIASMPPKDYRAARENFARPAWDASGTKLIYRSFDDQAQPVAISLWDAGTGESRVLLTGSEGFATALIGGDGRIVWAVTNTSRLLRLDLVRGLTDEILPPLGAGASGADGVGVPGSAILIRGTGFTKTQMALDGDVQLPLVDVAPEGLWVQIPWEYSSLSQAIHKVLIRSQNNPFEGLVSVTVTPRIAPHIATWAGQATGFEYAKAVHADFQSLVSPSSPARPGETVHVYLPGSARSGSSDWRPGSIDASGPSCHAAHVQVGKRRVAAAPNALPGLHGWFDWNLPSRPGHPRQRSSRTPAALLQRA